MLSHTETFIHTRFYTQKLLHTEAFTHRSFYTQICLHTDAFAHRHVYTQKLLHTDAFTHRSLYTQTRLHTEAFTHRHVYTQGYCGGCKLLVIKWKGEEGRKEKERSFTSISMLHTHTCHMQIASDVTRRHGQGNKPPQKKQMLVFCAGNPFGPTIFSQEQPRFNSFWNAWTHICHLTKSWSGHIRSFGFCSNPLSRLGLHFCI